MQDKLVALVTGANQGMVTIAKLLVAPSLGRVVWVRNFEKGQPPHSASEPSPACR